MMYENRLLRPILDGLDKLRAQRAAEAATRLRKIYETLPDVADIDYRLQSGMLEVARHAFRSGTDAKIPLAELRKENLALQKARGEILVKAGYPADYTEPKTDCAQCRR